MFVEPLAGGLLPQKAVELSVLLDDLVTAGDVRLHGVTVVLQLTRLAKCLRDLLGGLMGVGAQVAVGRQCLGEGTEALGFRIVLDGSHRRTQAVRDLVADAEGGVDLRGVLFGDGLPLAHELLDHRVGRGIEARTLEVEEPGQG
jgi:hypothetical protein